MDPNTTASISDHACDTNERIVPETKADTWQTSQDLYSEKIEAGDNADKQRQLVQSASLEEFPLMPRVSSRRRAVNSLLLHVAELSEDTVNASSDERNPDNSLHEFPDEGADSEECIDASDVAPTDARPFSIITPPDSPDKSNVATANTSMDTAVSTSTAADSNAVPVKRSGEGFHDEVTATETAALVQTDTATHISDTAENYDVSEPTMPEDSVCVLETTDYDNQNVSMDSHTISAVDSQSVPQSASPPVPPPLKLCKPHASYKVPSYDYAGQLTDSTCGESCVISDASDTIDSDIPSLPDLACPQRGLANQHIRQSLLFGNSCIPSAPTRPMEVGNVLIPPQLNSQNGIIGRDGIQMRSTNTDNIPLANIAMLLPTPECFQQTTSHAEETDTSPERSQHMVVPSKTRKLATALVKAAQLDGIRSIHRKIRPTGQHVSGSGRRSRGSSKASECSTCSIQCVASEPKPPLPPLRKRSSKKEFRFNELVAVYETWNREEYDRRGMPSAKLDPELIEKIKHELNEYKAYEMCVHEGARKNTHFIC
ncbi:hypothetical protein H4R20_002801 [Coemansia guatemalensis]|uniref:Uncharacterized protein n=1 Tax=Coemansia guatemalensis TaxID=2761395 RepID=A0A9W8HUH7_9FUNG|nr:hypothetical protein H4R20_002801 [Coemansia guatemalensis]